MPMALEFESDDVNGATFVTISDERGGTHTGKASHILADDKGDTYTSVII